MNVYAVVYFRRKFDGDLFRSWNAIISENYLFRIFCPFLRNYCTWWNSALFLQFTNEFSERRCTNVRNNCLLRFDVNKRPEEREKNLSSIIGNVVLKRNSSLKTISRIGEILRGKVGREAGKVKQRCWNKFKWPSIKISRYWTVNLCPIMLISRDENC